MSENNKKDKILTTTEKKLNFCEKSKVCGACQTANLSYDEQLSLKTAKTIKLISKYCHVEPIIGAKNPTGYRNKAQAVFMKDRSNRIVSGIYRSSTGTSVAVENCRLQTKEANSILKTLCSLFKSFKIKPFDSRTKSGYLRSVTIRQAFATGEIMVVISATTPDFPAKKTFSTALVSKHPQIKSIIFTQNQNTERLFHGTKEKVLWGKPYITDYLCGLEFHISALSFYQINHQQTEVLYTKAIEFGELSSRDTVLDAYCGIGTIGLIASKKAKKVVGFEINGDAVKKARENAVLNNIKNADFFKASDKEFFRYAQEEGLSFSCVFLDPPRAGCSRDFLNALCERTKPERIVYISCCPETQARDLGLLTSKGYKCIVSQPVDMFPYTNHTENIVLLRRR